MLKIIFVLILFAPVGGGYREIVGEMPSQEVCEEMLAAAHKKFGNSQQRYSVACLPVKGGIES